jgi:hypothetical protein
VPDCSRGAATTAGGGVGSGDPAITTLPRINPHFEQLTVRSPFIVEQRSHFQFVAIPASLSAAG